MKKLIFRGLGTALVTPMKNGKIDLDTFAANIDLQAAGGAGAVIVGGSTGESATLDARERQSLILEAVQAAAGRMAVIAGVGGNNTAQACEAAIDAAYQGVDAVLAVTPYYNKATQVGLIKHFTAIADASPAPVILYNVPSRTGVNIEPETYARLARHDNIAAVKESNPDLAAFQRTKALCGDELALYSGNDDTAIPMMACGAVGVVSVLSNVVPRAISGICLMCESGDYSQAVSRYARYLSLSKALFQEPSPIPVKTALCLMGLDSGELRLPLSPPEDAFVNELRTRLSELDLI